MHGVEFQHRKQGLPFQGRVCLNVEGAPKILLHDDEHRLIGLQLPVLGPAGVVQGYFGLAVIPDWITRPSVVIETGRIFLRPRVLRRLRRAMGRRAGGPQSRHQGKQ